MNALYSLYDALISINVPADRAKAVVDAMERDMTALLATKSDIALLRQEIESTRVATTGDITLLRQEIESTRAATTGDITLLRQEIESTRAATTSDITLLRQEIENARALLAKDIQRLDEKFEQKLELLRSSMTVRLGSIQIVSLGLLFAALKLI